ncbi:DUF1592 domain-containing protein [Sandaracinus amylolyticus]|uniref:DUF1592 domain-containing protein n=1 Tax=Sandaracinus amylolyticus TaxID=927083 RepID=UPI001F390ACD|nr:DUF1592 domain-containing protein [Sandaracinus amylolyticus]UJR83189.1 Hypothetical protein I5071_52550 [Sandaracinus amylolyticus]
MSLRTRSICVVAALALGACIGDLDDAPAGPGGGAVPRPPGTTRPPRGPLYACDDPSAVAPELPLRRLTSTQLRNTLVHLVESSAPSSSAAILGSIAPAMERLPADSGASAEGSRHAGFRRLDQAVQQQHVEVLYDVGVALGAAFTGEPARVGEIFGACASDADESNDGVCVRSFVRAFGERAFRRPLTDEDVELLASAADPLPITADALANVVALIVNSPELFYLPEHGQDGAVGATVPLDAFELAARLSYHFWSAPPDDELLEAARTGALLRDDEYERQLDRLVTDPRADEAFAEFFSDWLRLGEVADLDVQVGRPRFDAFAGTDVPTPELRTAMIDDVLEAARANLRAGSSLSDLLLDRRSYTRDPLLARIYGTSPWDGSGEPPTPPGARAGLLTRPAFLATGTPTTRPIMKGVLVRMALMCEAVPPPPANADAVRPEASALATTRDATEALTQAPGTACAGCHATAINPLGFATEGFDALGRERTVERIFGEDGALLAELPIDTHVVPNVIFGDPAEAEGAEDLTRLLDESGRVHSCMAREYFRFTFQRTENARGDGCSLAAIEEAVLGGASLTEIFASSARLRTFRERSFE